MDCWQHLEPSMPAHAQQKAKFCQQGPQYCIIKLERPDSDGSL